MLKLAKPTSRGRRSLPSPASNAYVAAEPDFKYLCFCLAEVRSLTNPVYPVSLASVVNNVMGLCICCRSIVQSLSHPKWPFYIKVSRRTRLSTSAKTCRLCRMIRKWVITYAEDETAQIWQRPTEISVIVSQDLDGMVVRAILSVPGSEDDLRIGVWAKKGNNSLLKLRFIASADRLLGSPAAVAGVMATRKPLVSNDPAELVLLLQPLLRICLSSHESCARTIAQKEINDMHGSELPTRLIDVNNGSDPATIRLVEPGRRIGRYCALSHCWGPPNRRPYTTTQGNIKTVFSGISVADLPRTFQDAIALTRALDIDYLWIDSLCIIQDDHEDWCRESHRMGAIYERAFLVIAAAASSDSTGGLFDVLRYPDLSIKVPFYEDGHCVNGTFNLTMLSDLPHAPYFGPLRNRGWAFQEWHLARRILFFMSGGITWMCRELELDESGSLVDHRSAIPSVTDGTESTIGSWLKFLYEYCGARLSIHTDRLPAIQGLVNEVAKIRPDNYHLGVWEEDLEKQLVWLPTSRRPYEDLPELPSWCWASVGGELRFLLQLLRSDQNIYNNSVKSSSTSLDFTTNNVLVDGVLRRAYIQTGSGIISNCCFRELQECRRYTHDQPFESQFIEDTYTNLSGQFFEVLDEQNEAAVVGIGAFDHKPYPEFLMLPLVLSPREGKDPLSVIRIPGMPIFWSILLMSSAATTSQATQFLRSSWRNTRSR